jgi:hypothetical protein
VIAARASRRAAAPAPLARREARGARAPRRRAASGEVRPATEADLPSLATLHRRVFGPPAERRLEDVEHLLGELLFRHPWRAARIPSLVYEEGGRVAGALGVLPRPMAARRRTVQAALGHNLMVAPERRASLAAVELMRSFLCGPQELSLAMGNDGARRLWRGLGIGPALVYSFRFTLLLRPASHLLAVATRRGLGGPTGWLKPVAALADRLAARSPAGELGVRPARATGEPLDLETLAELVVRIGGRRALRPDYDAAALGWMLALADRGAGAERIRRVLVRHRGATAGWYLYRLRRGVVELVQLGATGTSARDVLDHLVAEARRHRAVAVTGQLDPPLLPLLDERPCIYHRGRSAPWLLAHGRDERAVGALRLGEAFFTPLEGEWWA